MKLALILGAALMLGGLGVYGVSAGGRGDNCCDADANAAAACTGSSACKACKNCNSCKHCKGGGTCGVCVKPKAAAAGE